MTESIHVRDTVFRDIAIEEKVVVQFGKIAQTKQRYPYTDRDNVPDKFIVDEYMYDEGEHHQLNILRELDQVQIGKIQAELKVEISFYNLV